VSKFACVRVCVCQKEKEKEREKYRIWSPKKYRIWSPTPKALLPLSISRYILDGVESRGAGIQISKGGTAGAGLEGESCVSISGRDGSLNVWRAEGCNEWEDEEFLYVSYSSSTPDLLASTLNLAPSRIPHSIATCSSSLHFSTICRLTANNEDFCWAC